MDHTDEITFLRHVRSGLTLNLRDLKVSEAQMQIATLRQDITRRIVELQEHRECNWIQDSDGVWETSCKESFQFEDGGVEENMGKYCFYCGRSINAIKYEVYQCR